MSQRVRNTVAIVIPTHARHTTESVKDTKIEYCTIHCTLGKAAGDPGFICGYPDCPTKAILLNST